VGRLWPRRGGGGVTGVGPALGQLLLPPPLRTCLAAPLLLWHLPPQPWPASVPQGTPPSSESLHGSSQKASGWPRVPGLSASCAPCCTGKAFVYLSELHLRALAARQTLGGWNRKPAMQACTMQDGHQPQLQPQPAVHTSPLAPESVLCRHASLPRGCGCRPLKLLGRHGCARGHLQNRASRLSAVSERDKGCLVR